VSEVDRPEAGTLGRFAPGGHDGSAGPAVEVHLLRLPLLVLRASREHHDGLMREFRLLALSGTVADEDVPARLVDLTHILGERYGRSRERRDAELDADIAAGLEVVDRVEVVPASAGPAVADLARLLEEADAYCSQALLMTLPRPRVVKAFGQWYTGQFVDQIAGRPPVPWDGPLRADA